MRAPDSPETEVCLFSHFTATSPRRRCPHMHVHSTDYDSTCAPAPFCHSFPRMHVWSPFVHATSFTATVSFVHMPLSTSSIPLVHVSPSIAALGCHCCPPQFRGPVQVSTIQAPTMGVPGLVFGCVSGGVPGCMLGAPSCDVPGLSYASGSVLRTLPPSSQASVFST